MEITGIIIKVLPEQKINGELKVKNAFVIEWKDNGYPLMLCLDVLGEAKWDKMKHNIVVGNQVTCKFNATSREYNGKYFTSCNCWYCALVGAADAQQTAVHNAQPAPAPQDDSNLPF